jgi:pyrroloquinoline quinone (PQQ) biosynthesis protein C
VISEQLQKDIDAYVVAFRRSPLLERARAGEVTPAIVGRYLASIHYLLTQTPVHLSLAERIAIERGDGRLSAFFAHKRSEEESHHEWAESDKAELSQLFAEAAGHQPARAMYALVENTRDAIEREPALYLAHILFAEYFTVVVGPEWIDALGEKCGIPVSALSSIAQHVELDKHHVVEGVREIDELLVDDALHGPVRDMLHETMRRYSAFCDELCEPASAVN